MPRKKQVTKCRAASGCGQTVLIGGCFCADHELLWIAKSGTTSERIRSKHSKMYKQFRSQQERAQVQRRLEAYQQWINRQWINRLRIGQQAEQLHQMLERQQRQVINGMKMLHIDFETYSGADYVHGTTLRGFGEDHQADALKYCLSGVEADTLRAPRRQRSIGQGDGNADTTGGDRAVADESDRAAEEGQSEVSGVHVHRSV